MKMNEQKKDQFIMMTIKFRRLQNHVSGLSEPFFELLLNFIDCGFYFNKRKKKNFFVLLNQVHKVDFIMDIEYGL